MPYTFHFSPSVATYAEAVVSWYIGIKIAEGVHTDRILLLPCSVKAVQALGRQHALIALVLQSCCLLPYLKPTETNEKLSVDLKSSSNLQCNKSANWSCVSLDVFWGFNTGWILLFFLSLPSWVRWTQSLVLSALGNATLIFSLVVERKLSCIYLGDAI